MSGLENLCFLMNREYTLLKKTFTKQKYNDEYCLIKI